MGASKWHGWRIKHTTDSNRYLEVGVTQLPDRKRPCLYAMRDNILEPLAYFQTEEKAEAFMGLLDMIAKAEPEARERGGE